MVRCTTLIGQYSVCRHYTENFKKWGSQYCNLVFRLQVMNLFKFGQLWLHTSLTVCTTLVLSYSCILRDHIHVYVITCTRSNADYTQVCSVGVHNIHGKNMFIAS